MVMRCSSNCINFSKWQKVVLRCLFHSSWELWHGSDASERWMRRCLHTGILVLPCATGAKHEEWSRVIEHSESLTDLTKLSPCPSALTLVIVKHTKFNDDIPKFSWFVDIHVISGFLLSRAPWQSSKLAYLQTSPMPRQSCRRDLVSLKNCGVWIFWTVSICVSIYIYTCRYTRKHTLKCNRQCFLYQFLVRCVLWARHMIPRAHKLRLIPSSSSFKSVCAGSYHGHCFIWLWSFRCFCDALVLPLWRWCLGRDEVVQELDETNT